jgi:hypothetical protein
VDDGGAWCVLVLRLYLEMIKPVLGEEGEEARGGSGG